MPATMYQTNSYQQTDILTASPMELIVMLYDECIRTLEKAEAAFAEDGPSRIPEVGKHLLHAQDIICELAVSLDMENGGEIAENLHRLYDFAISHISTANVKQKVQPVRDVMGMMKELREAWQQIMKDQHQIETQPSGPMNSGLERGRFSMTG